MRAVCATGENNGNSEMGETCGTADFAGSSSLASLASLAHSRYCSDVVEIVNRIVPIRLISLTCSPT